MIKAAKFTQIADKLSDAAPEGGPSAGDESRIADEIKHACALILSALSLPEPSPESLSKAEDWYNDMDKGLMVERLSQWGVDLSRDANRLIPTWADVAMHVYAARLEAGLPVWPE